jgi:disulfide bond formation protein DsbB
MKNPIYWCFVIALTGSLVSLYYGEILWIEPCRICWYQRVALFPLALILGIGLFRGDPTLSYYALPLSLFGFCAAAMQAIGIHFPTLQICSRECAKVTFSLFGMIPFPDLSAGCFALVTILLFSYHRGRT